jgi:hypothetical protein
MIGFSALSYTAAGRNGHCISDIITMTYRDESTLAGKILIEENQRSVIAKTHQENPVSGYGCGELVAG